MYSQELLQKIEQRRKEGLQGKKPRWIIVDDPIVEDKGFVKVFKKYEKEWKQKNRLASKAEV
jgi:hypothetical protein